MSGLLRRSLGPGALVLGLLVGAVASGPAQAAPDLERCDIGTKRPFRCGHISVPSVRGFPELGNRPIGFALRPASDRSREPRGTIVFVEGGPGYAATNFDSIRPVTAVFAPFLRRYDLLAIDQRGTGRSRPLNCPGLQRGRVSASKGLRACAEQLGPLYQGYTTAESAADVEAVRQALGIERNGMILYGDSYGTYLGQSYAARYGQGMRGLILSSAYPITGESPFWPSLYPAARRAIRLACERFPECSGDALGRFDRVLLRAGTRSAFTQQILVFLMMSASSYAPGSYRRFNRAVSGWLEGRPRRLRLMTDPGPPGSGPPGYFSEGMYAAVV
ncbi:MAG: alpha/beta fold hydrolase, partial [Solirubrobacterales bacterium]